MRKLIMLSAFVLAAGFATAQEATATTAKKSCAKTCTKAEKKACAKTCTKAEMKACAKKGSASTVSADVSEGTVLSAEAQAVIAAESDENIERKECALSGKVSYFQKAVCEKSGKVSMNEVKYCTDAQAFVNASPSEVMSEGAAAKVIKTAETVDGKVQTTAKGAKKKCCKGKKKCGSAKTGA